jgi:8-oxo-dGTP pyrophosphatase MutT (NUDIX family)
VADIFESAGGVIVGPGNKIAVVNQHGNSWSLPKGHLEAGETAEAAAIREIFEETGIQDVTIIDKLGDYERGRIGPNGEGEDLSHPKHITIFLCTTNQTDLNSIDPENPEAEWLSIQDVADRLTNQKDKDFFHSITPKLLKYLAS